MSCPGDPGINLLTGELSALAGLGALSHLDLKLLSVDQIFTGNTEPARCDLLDSAVFGITVFHYLETLRILAALAGITAAAQTIHRYSQCLVSLLADRAI